MDKTTSEVESITQNNSAPIEESLISLEKIDRSSPEIWPEDGIGKFLSRNDTQVEKPKWNSTNEDSNQVYRLGNLTLTEIVLEVKRLHDEAYNLGIEESKEMTRGKYLDIFYKENQKQ